MAEAKKGLCKTAPNPAVGAVLVRNDRLLARGFHRKAGLPHAEIVALRKIKNPRGATLYVTLEPCCHLKKRTPPCTDALIQAGLKRIVVGTLDANPKVLGKGVQKLRGAGIKVDVLRQKACEEINTYYNYWMKTGRPWVLMKAAVSLDGRVALSDGRSQWITSEAARRRVHELRSQVDGILVGIGTVLRDDPTLNVRLAKKSKQPIRILWDPELTVPLSAKILSKKNAGPTWILTSKKKSPNSKVKKLAARGAEIIYVPSPLGKKIPAKKILNLLGRRGIQSLLLEGGPGIWTQFHREKAVQELCLFVAPKILGGDGLAWIGALKKKSLPVASEWKLFSLEKICPDLLLRWRLP